MDLVITILEKLVPLVVVVLGILVYRWALNKGATDDQLAYLNGAYDILKKAVLNTNQTWVDALKKSNGGLTAEEQVAAREKTIAIFNAMLTDEVETAIDFAYGSVDNWLNLNLEAAVGEVHK